MPDRLRQFVAWTTLAQVVLVGGLGTGLHGLFGCEHRVCAASCCVGSDQRSADCKECVFCRHAIENQRKAKHQRTADGVLTSNQGCDGCAVCDLLAQYHSATPLALDPPAIELASDEAVLLRQNKVVAAAIRFALSRGPPAA